MRRTLTLFVPALLVLGLGCSEQDILRAEPVLQVGEPVVEFDTVCVGDTAEYVLAVSNSGNAPLNITSVTSPDPEVEVVSYPEQLAMTGSASQGQIVIHWEPSGEGDMVTELVVESDDAKSPRTLTLTGHGDAGTRVDVRFLCEGTGSVSLGRCPTYLTFDDTAVGASAQVPVVLANEGCARLTVTDYFVADELGNPIEDPAAAWSVEGPDGEFTFARRDPVTLRPTFQPTEKGPYFGELHVVYEDRGIAAAPVDQRLSLGATATELELLFDPAAFSFVLAETGSPQQQSFRVRNLGTMDGTITAFEMETASSEFTLTPPAGEAPWDILAGEDLEFFVTYEPADVGNDSNAVLVRTNMGDFELPLRGGALPQLEIVPQDIVDFGAVATGSEAMREVILRNGGKAPLEIQGVRFTDDTKTPDGSPVFSRGDLPAMPFEIAPGAERSFNVRFKDHPNLGWYPTPELSSPSESSELAVKSNDPDYAQASAGLEAGETSILLVTDTEANFGPDEVVIVAKWIEMVDGKKETHYCDPALCSVPLGRTVNLSGAQTVDPEGDALAYDFEILQRGSGNYGSAELGPGELVDADVTVVPDYVGTWRFRLTVTDRYGNSKSGTYEVGVHD